MILIFSIIFWQILTKNLKLRFQSCAKECIVWISARASQILIPTHILLQNLALIQPITIPVKFARSPRTDPPGTYYLVHTMNIQALSEHCRLCIVRPSNLGLFRFYFQEVSRKMRKIREYLGVIFLPTSGHCVVKNCAFFEKHSG